MCRLAPIFLSVVLLGLSFALPAAAQRVGVAFNTGHHWPGAGERYASTQSSWWHFEGVIRYQFSPRVALGAGINWSVFEGGVPEFAVFEPLDHAPWLSQTHWFLDARYSLAKPDASVKPYVAGRFGWARDYAEFAGAEVRRAGPMVAAQPGVSLHVIGPLHLDVSALLALARLGEAQGFGERSANSSSGSSLMAVRAGFALWF